MLGQAHTHGWIAFAICGALVACDGDERPHRTPPVETGGAPSGAEGNAGDAGASAAGAEASQAGVTSVGDGGGNSGGEAGAPSAGAPNGGGCRAGAPSFDGARTLTVAGKVREYLVQLPPGYDPAQRYPVLFGLHGAGGNGPSFATYFPLRHYWQDKAILVYPSALFYPVDGRTTWRYPTEENLAFFDAMVAELDANLCVDRARIFASGFSSGGFFSNTLGCRRGDVVRAIVPVAGGDRDFNEMCAGHPAVMVISSPLDTSDPTGGPAGISHHERGLQARDYFRQRNGCTEGTEALQPDGCVQYQGCLSGAEVIYCEHGQGHAWPSGLHTPAAEFLASY